ncbi:trypsin-like serine protease [Streptomyces sp. NPDC002690]
MRHTRPLRLPALAAALLAVELTLAGAPASAVSGTADTDATSAFTARVEIGEGDAARACSGALVDEQWLLTAASCFVDNPVAGLDVPAGAPKTKTVATVGRTDLTSTAGQVRNVVKLVPHPDQDLVLAKLAAPVTGITPVELSTTAPVAGEELLSAGYGRTKDEWAPVRLHTGSFTATTVGDTEVAITGKDGAAVCKGDGGGPTFRRVGGSAQLVGINSRAWEGGCFGADPADTRTGAVDTRTDTVRTWIDATVGAVTPRHDYNGDGRSDIGVWYTYLDGHNSTFTLTAGSDATLTEPFLSYVSAVGAWDVSKMQFVTGDYDGDGLGDAAMLYDAGNDTAKIYTALGKPDGGFATPVLAWSNSWRGTSMSLHSGDFDGDGRDDIAVWYKFANGSDTLYTFTATADGLLDAPFTSFTSADGWVTENIKYVTGDYNGDGRDDLAGFADYNDGHVAMFTWLADQDGGFQNALSSWTSTTTWGDWNRATPYAGDFNGDGRDDVALWYDYEDGHDTVSTLTSTTAGKFSAPVTAWTGAAGAFTFGNLSVVAGDYNGDGRDDLAALGRYPVSETRPQEFVRMFTWPAKTTGSGFDAPVTGWSSTPGTWNFVQARLLDGDSDH